MRRFQLFSVILVLFSAVASAQLPSNPHSWWDGDDPSGTGNKPGAGSFAGPWVNKGSATGLDATGFGEYVPDAFEGSGAWFFDDDRDNPTSQWRVGSNSAFNFLHNGSDATVVFVGAANSDNVLSSSPRAISNNGGSGTVGIHITPTFSGTCWGCAHVWMTRGVGGSAAIQGDNLSEEGVWSGEGELNFVVARHQTSANDPDFQMWVSPSPSTDLSEGNYGLGGNGVGYSTANANGNGGGLLELGSADGLNPMWHGLYAEVILYDRALSSSEMSQLGDYLAGKYVPEPSSLTLLVIGLLGLTGYRRRNR